MVTEGVTPVRGPVCDSPVTLSGGDGKHGRRECPGGWETYKDTVGLGRCRRDR